MKHALSLVEEGLMSFFFIFICHPQDFSLQLIVIWNLNLGCIFFHNLSYVFILLPLHERVLLLLLKRLHKINNSLFELFFTPRSEQVVISAPLLPLQCALNLDPVSVTKLVG